jgi:hypothetical protein
LLTFFIARCGCFLFLWSPQPRLRRTLVSSSWLLLFKALFFVVSFFPFMICSCAQVSWCCKGFYLELLAI